MGYPTSEVDTAGLSRLGAVVQQAASGFEARREPLAPDGVSAGWASGAALAAAGTAWTTFLGKLSGEVREFGAGLTSSANEYRAADEEAAGVVRHANGKPVLR